MNDSSQFEKKPQRNLHARTSKKKRKFINLKASFLDLNIIVKHTKFETDVYDKRDAFPFFIVRMPYRDSNIPARMFYEAVTSEILRIVRTKSSKEMFQKLITILLTKMYRQGCENIQLKIRMDRLFAKRFEIFTTFRSNAKSFIQLF